MQLAPGCLPTGCLTPGTWTCQPALPTPRPWIQLCLKLNLCLWTSQLLKIPFGTPRHSELGLTHLQPREFLTYKGTNSPRPRPITYFGGGSVSLMLLEVSFSGFFTLPSFLG